MVYDPGATVQLTFDVRDAAGELTNAEAVNLMIRLPDGTLVNPAPTIANPPDAPGRYAYDYVAVQPGLHRVRWTSTGPARAFGDVFNVVDADWPAIVGLGETKHHLNIAPDDTSQDDELRGFIASASAVVEDIVGAVARRTVVDKCSGGGRNLRLSTVPVISVDQVLADGRPVVASDYQASGSGLIGHRWRWPSGVDNIEVTYTAGRGVVRPNVLEGTLELIRVNWRPQAGGNYAPFDLGESDDFGASRAGEGSLQGNIRLGFFVPNAVTERLMPNRRGPVVM